MILKTISRRIVTIFAFAVMACAPFLSIGSASAATAPCGSVCNGKAPSYNHCNDSQYVRTIAAGTPTAGQVNSSYEGSTFTDPTLLVRVRYSTKCQTLWAEVAVTRTIGRSSCGIETQRYVHDDVINPYYKISACPATGAGYKAAPMVNDSSPHSNANTAQITVFEERRSDGAYSEFHAHY